MNKKISILFLSLAAVLLFGCKKNASPAPATATISAGTVLSSEASVVMIPTYVTLANNAASLYSGAVTLQTNPTQQNLANCRQLWLNATAAYEVSSASLFGPNGSLGADPASLINAYPIDTFGINSLVNSSTVLTPAYIDSIPPYLTGFHGIEFELYGINGNKTAAEFTPQQLSYIAEVALNIKTLTWQVDSEWSGPFLYQFTQAGNGSSTYLDQRAAFSDLIFGIANIVETDGIYKLNGIFSNKSTIIQESPFANNSITDIENNLIGVQNIYYGQYGGNTGKGLSAFVSQTNQNLDNKMKTDISNAITAVGKITQPLSQAIYTQSTQMQVALNACDSLNDDIKTSLLIYINANTN